MAVIPSTFNRIIFPPTSLAGMFSIQHAVDFPVQFIRILYTRVHGSSCCPHSHRRPEPSRPTRSLPCPVCPCPCAFITAAPSRAGHITDGACSRAPVFHFCRGPVSARFGQRADGRTEAPPPLSDSCPKNVLRTWHASRLNIEMVGIYLMLYQQLCMRLHGIGAEHGCCGREMIISECNITLIES